MTRGEWFAAAATSAIIALFAAVIASGLADTLGHRSWFANGANVIQWVSAPTTFVAIVAGTAAYLNRTCAVSPFCFRLGEHPVTGTLRKVCTHHHTIESHRDVHAQHAAAHAASGRLDRGESHGGTV